MIELKNHLPNKSEIIDSINELKSLMDEYSILTFDKMEWWLLKYYDYYKKTHTYLYSDKFLHKMVDGSILRIPPCDEDERERFIRLYEKLDEVSEFQRYEKYFEKELIDYNKISNSKSKVKKWIIKNEKIADYFFLFNATNFDIKETESKIKINWAKNINIYVSKEEFKYNIKFFDVFDDLFWIKKVYPESKTLMRIEKEMNNIPLDFLLK